MNFSCLLKMWQVLFRGEHWIFKALPYKTIICWMENMHNCAVVNLQTGQMDSRTMRHLSTLCITIQVLCQQKASHTKRTTKMLYTSPIPSLRGRNTSIHHHLDIALANSVPTEILVMQANYYTWHCNVLEIIRSEDRWS